jgi:hypothetical protein
VTRDQFAADRSIALLTRVDVEAPVTEASLITWSLIALLVVIAVVVIGGPS